MFGHQRYRKRTSTRSAAKDAKLATTMRLFLRKARIRAAAKPAAEAAISSVEKRIAGKVMAASVAYGT